jgi:molybdate transport system ATP-binding protein
LLEIDIGLRRGDFGLTAAFAAGPGVTALFGPSGSGKTSLIEVVAGLARPDRGRIVLGGQVLTDTAAGVHLRPAARRIGVVFQDARLFPHLSVARNLSYGGARDRDRLVDLLGLGPLLSRRPATLSGGERQRVAIARALMAGPAALMMDEPLAGLDAPRKADILPYLDELAAGTGIPILYVTHAMAEVVRLARHLVLIDGGRIRQAGPVEDVLSDPALLPYLGAEDAGAVVTGRVLGQDAAEGLTRVALSATTLLIPGPVRPPDSVLRIRIPADGVILSLAPPTAISALNVLPVRIDSLSAQGATVAVALRTGTDPLLARITRRSAQALGLTPGMALYAIVKATALGG